MKLGIGAVGDQRKHEKNGKPPQYGKGGDRVVDAAGTVTWPVLAAGILALGLMAITAVKGSDGQEGEHQNNKWYEIHGCAHPLSVCLGKR